MRTTRLIAPTLVALALLASACGSKDSTTNATPRYSSSTAATQTIQIHMQDNKYVPDTVSVAAGAPVKFVFTNDGSVTHDAFIGDAAAQDTHEMAMHDSSGMGGHDGADMNAITVAPGKTGMLTHTFKAGDKLLIGCHEAGHYAGGMKLTITVP